MKLLLTILAAACLTSGCTFVACDRVFPKLTWYWSAEAIRCRDEQKGIPVHPEIMTNSLPFTVGE